MTVDPPGGSDAVFRLDLRRLEARQVIRRAQDRRLGSEGSISGQRGSFSPR